MGVFLLLNSSCKKPDTNPTVSALVPVLTTSSVTNIAATTASCGGNVSSDGGATVTARGICWSTSQNPTIANSKTTDSTGIGKFTSTLTGLTANTMYYVRAYATNSAGTGYGSSVSFTTQQLVTDIDGNVYHVVTIGTQVWLAENLKTTHYNDGTPIPNVTDTSWNNLKTGAYCNYNNSSSNSDTYGRLYNWYAATSSHNICPKGWHVPTDSEWTVLDNYLGGDNVAGGKLKETGTTHWQSPNTGATNETGFSALPGGLFAGTSGNIGVDGVWWSSTAFRSFDSWYWDTHYSSSALSRSNYGNTIGLSIRCVKD
jgi:uncharacterized protein (TIGR02145 family)